MPRSLVLKPSSIADERPATELPFTSSTLTTIMTDVFPPEVFDAILDHVHILDGKARANYDTLHYSRRRRTNDLTKPVKTLLRCSLVCRSWLPRTRLHTFGTVYLAHYDRTIGVTFGALVAHPLCTFRSHVRRLWLHESYNRRPTEAYWLNSVLPQLALLPNVEDISIDHARFTNVAEEEWRAGVSLFSPQLKCLDIQSTHFDTIGRMTELVSRCTNLEHLGLRYIYLGKDVGDGDGAPKGNGIVVTTPPSRFLQSLSLHHGIAHSAEFLTWLCPSPGSIQIPTVGLEGISVKDARHVSRFLYNIGGSITSLTIDFSDSSSGSTDGQDVFCRVANLTTLTNLETLRFGHLGIYPIHMRRELSAKHVPLILAKLNSPCLKEIRFQVSMKMIDWESIVPTLNDASYSSLKVLSFTGIKEEDLEEAKTWLDERVGRKLEGNVEIRCATVY